MHLAYNSLMFSHYQCITAFIFVGIICCIIIDSCSSLSNHPTAAVCHHRRQSSFISVRKNYILSAKTSPERKSRMFDGGQAGIDADDNAIWDDTKMSGPLGKFADDVFLERFRTALAASNLKFSEDYPPGYDGMIVIVKEIIETADTADVVVAKSRATLNSLFPNWPPTFGLSDRVGLLYWFEILFAKPFPEFSSKLNAWVTWWAAQWLMGPCELQDLDMDEIDDKTKIQDSMIGDGRGQLVRVKRCRYLESGSCASLCVNSCKLPTQQFFNDDMGVPMRMIPDYQTYECRFEFGISPTPEDEEEARNVSCFSQCTSKKKRPDGQTMVSCG